MITTDLKLHIALIEWDSATDPTVLIGPSYAVVAREAIDQLSEGPLADDPGFWATHDVRSDLEEMTEEQLRTLHAEIHEATTAPWVTFYEVEINSTAPLQALVVTS